MVSEQILYIVATPIGNRADISERAIDVLQQVDCVYAEDTRHSLPLLRHHGIQTSVSALHEHNESARVQQVIDFLSRGGSAALITDAGTPLISDPGYRIVKACLEAGVRVSPIPGPSALTAALSVCGLPTDRFQFNGFAPHRAAARLRWLRELAGSPHTMVLYESPHRITDCLNDIVAVFGPNHLISVSRELTKRYETILYGEARIVLQQVIDDVNQQRGEFVIVIGPGSKVESSAHHATMLDMDQVLDALRPYLPGKTSARVVAQLFDVNKREAYERELARQKK